MQGDHVQVTMLIEAYRNKPVLWDTTNKNYYYKRARNQAWQEISAELKYPVHDLKQKMDNLLSSLRRERMKIKNSMSTAKGPDDYYTPSWYAYPLLQFLENRKLQKRKRIKQDDHCYVNIEEQRDIVSITTGTTESLPLSSSSLKPLKSKRMTPSNEEHQNHNIIKSIPEISTPSTAAAKLVSPEGLDESQLYANYIASKFRQYSPSTRNTLQYEIGILLYKADCGHYDLPDRLITCSPVVTPYNQSNEDFTDVKNF